jgi:hypothetical protein
MKSSVRQFNFLDLLFFALLFVIFLIIGYSYLIKGVCGVYHDDAIYISTAKALAEGKGYRLINFPDSPVQTRYPILYPSFLALIWKLWPNFPQNIFPIKLFSLLVGALAIGICYLYFIRYNYSSRYIAFSSCVICATTPSFLFFATNALSEIPFLFLLLLSLWVLENSIRTFPKKQMHDFFAGILLGLCFLCRSIGVGFIMSIIVFHYRRKIQMSYMILGLILIISPWLIWMLYSLATENNEPLKGYYLDYIAWWTKYGFTSIASIFCWNSLLVVVGVGRYALEGLYILFSKANIILIEIIVCTFFGSIFWLNYWKELREGRLSSWFLFGYFFIIIFWPWPPARFLISILPFLIVSMMLGSKRIFGRVGSKYFFKGLTSGLIAFLILTNLVYVYMHIAFQNRTGYPQNLSKDNPVYWSSYEDIFKWVEKNSSSNDIIASGLDSMVYLYTGRQSFRPFFVNATSLFYNGKLPALGTSEEFQSILKTLKPKYFIYTPMPGFSEEKYLDTLLEEIQTKYPGTLFPVYIGEDIRFRVYKINLD